jgi:hypothetical protein
MSEKMKIGPCMAAVCDGYMKHGEKECDECELNPENEM